MKKTVIASSGLPADLIEKLKENFEVNILDTAHPNFLEEYEAKLPLTHGIVGFGLPLTSSQLARAKLLEAVSTVSVGYDRFDLPALSARKIKLTHTPDVLTETTADLGFTLMMSAARRIPELSRQIQRGGWTLGSDDLYGRDIYGKTLGIIGFGRIGQAVARRGHFGFGMPVLYYNRTERSEAAVMQAKRADLDELCAESDFICVVIPSTPETKNLIGPAQFTLMKKTAIFVNIARGAVVDEEALTKTLRSKSIFSAGLDVFQKEPLPVDSPLIQLENVVLTPHVGSATEATRYAMAELAILNLSLALQGQKPPNLVNERIT